MGTREFAKRIIALALAAVIMLPLQTFALEETGETAASGITQTEAGDAAGAGTVDEASGTNAETASESSEQTGDAASEAVSSETEAENGIRLRITRNSDDRMKVSWKPVEGAASYTVTKTACSAYDSRKTFDEDNSVVTTDKTYRSFKKLWPGRLYTYTVTAYDNSGNVLAESIEPVSAQPVITPPETRVLKSEKITPEKQYFASGTENLREYIKEPVEGYACVQGGCTDGKYAYYLMVNTRNQRGKIAKVRLRDNKLIKVSKKLRIWHGNGMAYDSRRKQLVVTSRDEPDRNVYKKQEITCIDAKTLKIIKKRKKNVRYTYFAEDESNFTEYNRTRGLASIAYNAKYDVYIADQRNSHNLIIIDPETFEAIGLVRTRIVKKYPAVYQGMDADDQFAYILLSPDGEKQTKNLILALDWNSSVLLDEEGHRRQYVPERWNCLNNKRPAAVFKIRRLHEAENIFHTVDEDGNNHFYLADYHYDPKCRKITYAKKYKVRWKKETEKIKVNGKWKKQKVWKYKTKYRIVTKRVRAHKNRLDNIYDLGVI